MHARYLFERRWMRGLAADPYLAALEMLFFPYRYNCFQPINREPARLERLSAMRRRDRDRHRSLADFDDAGAMRDRDARDFPSRARRDRELAHLGQRHRLVGFVLEANYDAARVIAASRAGERHDCAGGRVGNFALERGNVDRIAADGYLADVCGRICPAADRRNERNLVAGARLEAAFDIFLVDGETDRVVMPAELGKFNDQLPPDVADCCAVGKLTAQLSRVRPLAQRREQLDREPAHRLSSQVMCPSWGMSSFSIASRHASGEPGSAATNLPWRTPATAPLIIAAAPIS